MLDRQLAQVQNAQLIRRLAEEELAYLCKHALTQESAFQSLLHSERRQIHLRMAQGYEQFTHLYTACGRVLEAIGHYQEALAGSNVSFKVFGHITIFQICSYTQADGNRQVTDRHGTSF